MLATVFADSAVSAAHAASQPVEAWLLHHGCMGDRLMCNGCQCAPDRSVFVGAAAGCQAHVLLALQPAHGVPTLLMFALVYVIRYYSCWSSWCLIWG